MVNKEKRTLEYDKDLDKYVLFVENTTDIKSGPRVVGKQTHTIKQVWDKNQINLIRSQVTEQKMTLENQLRTAQVQLKQLPRITDRERTRILKVLQDQEKAVNLKKIIQLEEQANNIKQAIKKVNKDLKEIENAVKN